MVVPTQAGRFFFVTGLTAGISGLAVARTARGDDGAAGVLAPVWARRVARGIGMKVRIFGTEHIDRRGPQVFMCNHQSHTDVIALLAAMPIRLGFLAKAELREVPLFGRAMDAGGHVFVDRRDPESAHAAIGRAAVDVAEGRNIVVFPEGTRSAAGTVKRFKKGGFHLAQQAGVPIVPIGIRGTARVLPKHGKGITPGSVDIHIGAPVASAEVEDATIDELVLLVRGRVKDLAHMRLVDER